MSDAFARDEISGEKLRKTSGIQSMWAHGARLHVASPHDAFFVPE